MTLDLLERLNELERNLVHVWIALLAVSICVCVVLLILAFNHFGE